MSKELSRSARKVSEALNRFGFKGEVLELKESTRTSAEAAQVIGCDVAQIVKSLVFKTSKTKMPVLVVTSGANRVNTARIKDLVSEPVRMADPDFVRTCTGYAIGGVPPVGHRESMQVYIDSDLFHYQELWAAAGTPHAMFKLTPAELKKMTQGHVVTVT